MSTYQKIGYTHFYTFGSLGEFTDEVLPAYRASHNGALRNRLGNKKASWIGRAEVSNPGDAAKLVHQTWDEGMKIVERMLETLHDADVPKPVSIKRKSSWSEDQGGEVCLDRLRAGQAFWRTTKRSHRPGPVAVTIIANLGARVDWSPSMILWRGAAAIVLTEILEAAGYRVELWGARFGWESYADKQHHAMAINYKRTSEPLDKAALINAVSGWFYRMMGLASIGMRKEVSVSRNCGASFAVDSLTPYITNDEQTIVADGIYNEQSAIAWVRRELEKIINPRQAEPESNDNEATVIPAKQLTREEQAKANLDAKRAAKAFDKWVKRQGEQ